MSMDTDRCPICNGSALVCQCTQGMLWDCIVQTRESRDALKRQLKEAQAACAAIRELLPYAYSDGQKGAGTDLTRPEPWERSDAYYELTRMPNPGQPILDDLTRLRDAIEAMARGTLVVHCLYTDSRGEYFTHNQDELAVQYTHHPSPADAALAGLDAMRETEADQGKDA